MGKARTELSAETWGNTKEAPTPALPGNTVYSVLEERVGISLQEAKEKKLPERGSGRGGPGAGTNLLSLGTVWLKYDLRVGNVGRYAGASLQRL